MEEERNETLSEMIPEEETNDFFADEDLKDLDDLVIELGDEEDEEYEKKKQLQRKRILIVAGAALFAAAVTTTVLLLTRKKNDRD